MNLLRLKMAVRCLPLILVCFLGSASAASADELTPGVMEPAPSHAGYYWRATPVGNTAQILALFCSLSSSDSAGTPLIAVLRDTLGDENPDNDRLTYVWLLGYQKPGLSRRLLSGVPFFYWRPGEGSGKVSDHSVSPLLNLAAVQHPMWTEAGRDILQFTILDPAITPMRATSRAYRANEMDFERLHLEEAISYLRQAPSSNADSELTLSQLNTVIARLELRKRLLGGFVGARQAEHLGSESGFRYERVRSRDWEILRQCAEETGLYFESVDVAGTAGQYGMLWFPLGASAPAKTTLSGAVWKLLSLKDPWSDPKLRSGPVAAQPYLRQLDNQGALLPPGSSGATTIHLAPLGIYSLTCARSPLLLIDFRDRLHVRRHEMTQRSINEMTSGVIGISHFTNWYYYVAADFYDFFVERHGAAVNASERLDCYAKFRVQLALDRQLDPRLREDLEQRVRTLELNPLEIAPHQAMEAASARYAQLLEDAQPRGRMAAQLDRDRRQESAAFGQSHKQAIRDTVLHLATFGGYTQRIPPNAGSLAQLDVERRVRYQLQFLNGLGAADTPPEVAYDPAKIQQSVQELSELMRQVNSPQIRQRASLALERVRSLSQDSVLQAKCSEAVLSLQNDRVPAGKGIAAKASIVRVPERTAGLR